MNTNEETRLLVQRATAGDRAALEELDADSQRFAFCKAYQSPERLRGMIRELLDSTAFSTVTKA